MRHSKQDHGSRQPRQSIAKHAYCPSNCVLSRKRALLALIGVDKREATVCLTRRTRLPNFLSTAEDLLNKTRGGGVALSRLSSQNITPAPNGYRPKLPFLHDGSGSSLHVHDKGGRSGGYTKVNADWRPGRMFSLFRTVKCHPGWSTWNRKRKNFFERGRDLEFYARDLFFFSPINGLLRTVRPPV